MTIKKLILPRVHDGFPLIISGTVMDSLLQFTAGSKLERYLGWLEISGTTWSEISAMRSMIKVFF